MRCHHYCNNTLRCPTCLVQFYRWVEARTNSKPPKKHANGSSFYACVNVISPPVST